MKKILVPIDGSESSKNAMTKAKEIATKFASDITILNVISSMNDYRHFHNKDLYKEDERVLLRESNSLLESSKEYFDDFPGKVESLYKRGDTAEEIIKYAEEGNFDLLVMGSRGLGSFSRTLLGSISNKVVHHTHISVLIVK